MVDEESLRKVGATAKLVVGGRTRARVGGKDNMWVVNILMSGRGARDGDEEDGKGKDGKI